MHDWVTSAKFECCLNRGVAICFKHDWPDAENRGVGDFESHCFFTSRIGEAVFDTNKFSRINGQSAGGGHADVPSAVIDFHAFTDK